MKLSGSTIAILASLLSGTALSAVAAAPGDTSPHAAKFLPSPATATLAPHASAPAAVHPEGRQFPLLAKRPASGLVQSAPFPAAETRPKTMLSFPQGRPVARTVTLISPAAQPPVHFWHWRGAVASPPSAAFSVRPIAEKVYRPGHTTVSRSVAPAGLNRFVFRRDATPTAPAQPGAAPLDSR